MTTTRGQVLAILLDGGLRTWGTREDLHLEWSRGLVARGVRPVLVFSDAPVEELRRRFQSAGAEVEAINYAKGKWHYFTELGKVVRKYSVTAVHIAFFNYFDPLPWMARLRGVRYIVYHERNPGVLRAKSWRRWLIRLRTRVIEFPMTRVIAISEFIKSQLIQVGIPAEKISRVYHGVDTRLYSPDAAAGERFRSESGVRPGEIVLAALSYLKPHKNIDVMLEACAEVTRRGVRIRFFVIGDGEMRGELESLGHKLGIADRVHWLGHIPNPVPVLQGCDIFLMVATGEGFGLAIAEAMACGAASVAADSGALPEIVEDGTSGLVVPPRDAPALANAIERLARNEAFRRQLGSRGLERVRQHFTTAQSIENLLRVYDSMWSD